MEACQVWIYILTARFARDAKHAEMNVFSIAAERTAMERLIATKLEAWYLAT
jgi:hypothetical protein